MSTPKKKFTAVIGSPIGHSLSPTLHNAMYKREGIDAEMRAIESKDIAALVSTIRATPLELTAVTIPHKQTIMPLLDVIDPEAKAIGAVNTVINKKGVLFGYNTDIIGIEATLKGLDLRNKKTLILGAGGASQTIAYYLKKVGARIFCYNREKTEAEKLVSKFGGTVASENDVAVTPFDFIINATPLGMHGIYEDKMPVPESALTPNVTVFDCVYRPLETKLLKVAKQNGARTLSGLTMFVEQGLAQEELWLGKKTNHDGYAEMLKKHL